MALLRPRIRVEDEDLAEHDGGRERFEELRRLGFQEDDVVQFTQCLLAHGAFDAVRDQVDAHAEFLRVGRGVGGQPVTVAAAELEGDVRPAGQGGGQRRGEAGHVGGSSGIRPILAHDFGVFRHEGG